MMIYDDIHPNCWLHLPSHPLSAEGGWMSAIQPQANPKQICLIYYELQ